MALRVQGVAFNYEAYHISAVIQQSIQRTVYTPGLTAVTPVIVVIPWPLSRGAKDKDNI